MSVMSWRFGGLLLACGVAACVPLPKDQPTVTIVDGSDLGLGSTPAPTVPDRWWTAFGDAQLDALIDRALAGSPDMALALARIDSARAGVLAARAPAGIGVNLDAGASRERLSANAAVPPPYGGGVYWTARSAIGLDWDVDFWGRQRALINAARDMEQASVLDHRAARLALAGALAEAYVDFDRALAFSGIASRAVAQRREVLAITRARAEAGLDSDLELRRVESTVPQARAARLQAEAAAALARHRLAALTGQGADAYARITAPQIQLAAALPLPDSLPLDLLRRRPDVEAARLRLDAAMSRRQAAAAAFYPDINLHAFAGLSSIGLDRFVEHDAGIYGGTALLHLPLFDSRRLRADYGVQTAAVDAAIARYNTTVLAAVREVADQLSLVDSYGGQVRETQDALTAAESVYRIAAARYKAGLTTQLSVLDTESRLLKVRREAVNSIARAAIARINLVLALGGHYESESEPESSSHPAPTDGAADGSRGVAS